MFRVGFWGKLVGLLLPHDPSIAIFDTVTVRCIAQTACNAHVKGLVSCVAPFPFSHRIVRTAVHAAKYHGHERAANLLGQALAPFVAETLADKRMMGHFTSLLLVPIPLHPSRMSERGFNQCDRIAAALVAELNDTGSTLDTTSLKRIKNTAHQARETSRTKRVSGMRGAFAVAAPELVRGRDVVLLDDVITTGATMREARDTLLAAGARKVLCVAVAH